MPVCEEHGEKCKWVSPCRDEAGIHTVKYFDIFGNTQSLAAPGFILPPVQEGQQPICRWGIIHAKILHLKNNWKTSDVAGETRAITNITDPQFSLTDVAICSDRIMAPRPNQPKHKYGIWNFNNVLGEPIRNIDGSLTEFNITHCHMNDEYMFFLQDLVLQVYKRDGDSYAYAFKCLFHASSSLCGPGSIFTEPDEGFQEAYLQLHRPTREDRSPNAHVCLVRHLFVGLIPIEESAGSGRWTADIHVWNLNTQKKLHQLPMKVTKKNEFGLISSNTNDNLIIYYAIGRFGTDVFTLNLTTFSHTHLIKIIKRFAEIVFDGNLLATGERMSLKRDRINTYNVNANGFFDSSIDSYVFPKLIVHGSVKIRGGNVGLCTDGQLLVIKANELRTQVFQYRYQKPGMTQDRGVDYQFGEFNTILLVDPNKLPKKIRVFNLTGGTLIKSIERSDNIFPCIRSQHLFILQEDHDEQGGTSKLIKCIHFW